MKLPDDAPTPADILNAAACLQDANLSLATHLASQMSHEDVTAALKELGKSYMPGHPVNMLAVIGATVYGETVREAIKDALR